jgi:hypothetical protein
MPRGIDFALVARLRARVELAKAELWTLEAMPLEPRIKTILEISKIDLTCATTRLNSQPDAPELEHLGRWLEMVENQLRTVRHTLTTDARRRSA